MFENFKAGLNEARSRKAAEQKAVEENYAAAVERRKVASTRLDNIQSEIAPEVAKIRQEREELDARITAAKAEAEQLITEHRERTPAQNPSEELTSLIAEQEDAVLKMEALLNELKERTDN